MKCLSICQPFANLIIQNKNKKTIGIITDGQIRRFNQNKKDLLSVKVKDVMTKNPISIDKNALAAKALSLMNSKKITSESPSGRSSSQTLSAESSYALRECT